MDQDLKIVALTDFTHAAGLSRTLSNTLASGYSRICSCVRLEITSF